LFLIYPHQRVSLFKSENTNANKNYVKQRVVK